MEREEFLSLIRKFEGQLLDVDSFKSFPNCQFKEDLKEIARMALDEELDIWNFRVREIPIERLYYIDRATEKLGVEYFCIEVREGKFLPCYDTNELNADGYNHVVCETIKESIEKMEC